MLAQEFLDHAPNRRINNLDAVDQFAKNNVSKSGKEARQLNDKVFVVKGRANSAMTFVEAPQGLIVIDCFMRPDDTAEALQLFYSQHIKQKVAAIVIVNGKHTHMGGMDPMIEHVKEGFKLVVAEKWTEYQQNLDVLTQDSDEFATLFEATDVVLEQGQVIELAGLRFDLLANSDARSKLDILFHIPTLQTNNLDALNMAELEHQQLYAKLHHLSQELS